MAQAVIPARPGVPATLERLLATATRLFALRGYHGVSVREIADAMGVRPSSMYMHFGSKEELLAELVYLANEQIFERLRRAVLNGGPAATGQLEAAVRAYVAFHTELPLLATLGHNDLHVLTGAGLARVATVRKAGIDLLRDVIERGNTAGEFDCEDPMLAIAAIAGAGIRVASWYRDPGQPPVEGGDYAAAVRGWMAPGLTVQHVQDTFTAYALRLVRSPAGGRDVPRVPLRR